MYTKFTKIIVRTQLNRANTIMNNMTVENYYKITVFNLYNSSLIITLQNWFINNKSVFENMSDIQILI